MTPELGTSAATELQRCVDIKARAKRGKCFDEFTKRAGFQRRNHQPVRGKWKLKTSRSKMDDSLTVTLTVDANQKLIGSFGRAFRPSLVLRCQEGRTEAYVVTGHSQSTEAGNYDGATVTIRFDKDPAVDLNTSESTSGNAFFLPGPEAFMRRLTGHQRLLFRFTPYRSSPQDVAFNVGGLSPSLPRLAEACQWSRPYKVSGTAHPWYLAPL